MGGSLAFVLHHVGSAVRHDALDDVAEAGASLRRLRSGVDPEHGPDMLFIAVSSRTRVRMAQRRMAQSAPSSPSWIIRANVSSLPVTSRSERVFSASWSAAAPQSGTSSRSEPAMINSDWPRGLLPSTPTPLASLADERIRAGPLFSRPEPLS